MLISLATMRQVQTPSAKIGQVVRYTGDMANQPGEGAVIAIRQLSTVTYDVALADGRMFPGSFLDSSRWQVSTEIVDADTLAVLRAGVAAKDATDAAAASSAAQAFEAAKERIKAENPHLTPGSGFVHAAKNLRIELKRAFPGVKFSVRSEGYSGGNHINVNWTDGPTVAQVEEIADKYQGGDFDGMTDCYNYRRSAWCDVFGDTKYMSCIRHYSDALVSATIERVCAELGGMDSVPTVEDYRRGRLYEFKQDGGCDVERTINTALTEAAA